jgi:hypothetical protein
MLKTNEPFFNVTVGKFEENNSRGTTSKPSKSNSFTSRSTYETIPFPMDFVNIPSISLSAGFLFKTSIYSIFDYLIFAYMMQKVKKVAMVIDEEF